LFRVYAGGIHVFVVAFSLLFLEILFFKIGIFVNDYISALFIISYALLGLGIGAFIADYATKLNSSFLHLGLILSFIFSFLNYILFPDFLLFSPFIILPFVFGAIVIAYYLREKNAHNIYFFDLVGAAAGVFSALIFFPLFREENSFLLILLILCIVFFLREVGKSKKWSFVFGIFSILVGVTFAFNFATNTFNLATITTCSDNADLRKIFCWDNPDIHSSYGSNVQRIDVINSQKDSDIKYTAYDGLINDNITTYNYLVYKYDRRIINNLVQNKQPHFFIIGTAAQGIVKTAAAQEGKITGVELNSQIVKLMSKGELYDFSNRAYDHIDTLHAVDARTFLNSQKSEQYDVITLINTHLARTVGHFSPPQFLHTEEAVQEYFNHLNNDGFIVLEERNINERAELGILRILNTFTNVMKEQGVTNPEDHIFIYDWYGENNRSRGNLYTSIVIKKNPLTEKDWGTINIWASQLGKNKQRKEIIPIFPDNKINPLYTNTEDITTFKPKVERLIADLKNNEIRNISSITDDKPYPWATSADHSNIKNVVMKSAGISILLLLLLISFWERKHVKERNKLHVALFGLYFSLLGLGYLIVEVSLIHIYQIFLGSPSLTLIFTLGTLLISSGIGSWVSKKLTRFPENIALIGILASGLYHIFLNKQIILTLSASTLTISLFIAFTILPIGFFMGMLFPLGIEKAKNVFSSNYTTLFFAINSIFSAFAGMAGIYLSLIYGFRNTLLIGLIAYICAYIVLKTTLAK